MPALAKERILLVDDEPQVLVALEDLLSEEFSVMTSSSASTALGMLSREQDIAVLVTDQRMPRMSGDELLAQLDPECETQRILVTGFADLTAVVRAVNEGRIFAYVTKPWNEEDLRLKVQKAALQFRLSRELERERQLLHDLMDNIPDGVYFKNSKLEFERANHAFAMMMGRATPAELVGRRLEEISESRVYTQVGVEEERRILKHGMAVTDMVRETRLGRGRKWFSETKAPIRDAGGEVVGLVGIVRDVTERIAKDEALRLSEERLRDQTRVLNAILQSMGEGVVVADRTGMLVHLNPQARELLGWSAGPGERHEWTVECGIELPDEGPLAPERDPLMRAVAGEATSEMEILVRNRMVPETRLAVTARPVNDIQGERLGGVVVLRDITQQRQLEEQLAQSQKMEAIGQLAGGIAHDFNNHLAVIMSYAQLIFEALPADDEKRADAREIIEASKRSAGLTSQLLSFSRRRVVRPTLLDLNETTSGIEKMLRRLIHENITFTTELEPGLGTTRADRGQAEQVILNLVLNARDAMPDGGSLTLRTSNARLSSQFETHDPRGDRDSYVLLSVSDTGLGMDPETQRRVFEPFFTTKGVGKGTGLGLSTVYGIVKQCGGHIAVRSELGRGSSFDVYLPRVDELAVAHEEPAQRAPIGTGRLGTILVLEDDRTLRCVTARVLREEGHTVIEASDAEDARRLCMNSEKAIRLLLTDLVMPDVSGAQLARELVGKLPGLRVLFMSGYASNANAEEALMVTGARFLEKPFAPTVLLSEVERILTDT